MGFALTDKEVEKLRRIDVKKLKDVTEVLNERVRILEGENRRLEKENKALKMRVKFFEEKERP